MAPLRQSLGPGSEPAWWKEPLTWALLIAGGYLVAELTRQPWLGAVLACAKFGWNDFLTARWLRGIDPHRGRGRACFWLYVAWGLSKVVAAGAVLAPLLLFLRGVQNQGPRLRPLDEADFQQSLGACIAVIMGIGMTGSATLLALRNAAGSGVRLWLGPQVHQARRLNAWPSSCPSRDRTNRAVWFLGLGSGAMVWTAAWAAVLLGALVAQLAGGIAPRPDFLALAAMAWVPLLVGPRGLLVPIPPHLAGLPSECWGDPPRAGAPPADVEGW
jgi:hypothetical protein